MKRAPDLVRIVDALRPSQGHGALSATMKTMKRLLILAAAALMITAAANAQDKPKDQTKDQTEGSYEFILAKIASSEGRFDEALVLLDKVIQKNPNNNVLLFERAVTL